MPDRVQPIAVQTLDVLSGGITTKQDADYVFYELTRSICPTCRIPIDAQIVLRDGKVFMRKRCPEHGRFEALVYADASLAQSRWRIRARSSVAARMTAGCVPTTSSTPVWASSRSTAPATCSARCVSRTPVRGSA